MGFVASLSSISVPAWYGWLLAIAAVLFYHLIWSKPKLKHEQKVARIQKEILDWNRLPASERRPLCTARARSLTIRAIGLYKSAAQRISFADMNGVVHCDTERRIVRVEPLIDMGELADYLVPRGYSLPVVPELKMLTVGGLVMGIGIESASHKYGLFHNIVRACTIILADGRILTVSRQHEPELFSSIFFSCGSWCFLLSVDIDIVPIDPYIRVEYTPYGGATELIQAIDRVTKPAPADAADQKAPDFIEGLLFSKDCGVLCVGHYVSAATVAADRARLHRVWWFTELYYAVVRDVFGLKRRTGYQYLSVQDYYFRHDRGLFWALELLGGAIHWFAFRLLFGGLLNYNSLIRDLFPSPVWSKSETETAWERVRMVSDAVVPLSNATQSFPELQTLFEVYPIWFCPTRIFHHTEVDSARWLFNFPAPAPGGGGGQFLDIGLYGVPHSAAYARDHVFCQRAMEEIVRREGGFMFNYSVGYSTPDEFWQTFDRAQYDRIRKLTGADGSFVDLYTKLGGGDKITRWLAARQQSQQSGTDGTRVVRTITTTTTVRRTAPVAEADHKH